MCAFCLGPATFRAINGFEVAEVSSLWRTTRHGLGAVQSSGMGRKMQDKPKIAIIGAGFTGVHLARRLSARADVIVFEKSRGIGGRMSTRRAGVYQFDHGAQYFTAKSEAFRATLQPYLDSGVVATWVPRLATLCTTEAPPRWTAPRYVAVPGMNALCKAMAEGLSVALETRVGQIAQGHNGLWGLQDTQGTHIGDFDWVISTAPAEQTVTLMPPVFCHHASLRSARMLGCFSLMVGGMDLSALGWDAAVVHDNPIAWIALNHSKPGRSQAFSVLCQSSNDWAEARLEHPNEVIARELKVALYAATGVSADKAEHVGLHKWRFALVKTPAGHPFLLDPDARLAAAGDWCGAGRVEAGFESAEALATDLLSRCFE